MRSKTIAIVASIAALGFAAIPLTAVAATTHHTTAAARVDHSRDIRDVRHVDPTPDKSSVDASADHSADTLDR
jgi:hypothetical protein